MVELLQAMGAELVRPLGTSRGLGVAIVTLMGLALVVAGSFVRTMLPLRALTLTSNLFLMVAAVLTPNPASILLHLILIPLNSYRLIEIARLSAKVTEASLAGDLSGLWLKPYMASNRMAAGTTVFRKGDPADVLYLLVEGELELVEIGRLQPVGEIFGEVAFFSPERKRTLTARCQTDCLLMSISEPSFKQLYFQHPKFAFQVSFLLAQRLGKDRERLQERLNATQAQQLEDA